MRKPFTMATCEARGITRATLRWKVKTGQWQRVIRRVYVAGTEPATDVEQALAVIVAADGVASHRLAGVLLDLDSVEMGLPFGSTAKRTSRKLPGLVFRSPVPTIQVQGIPCTADG